MKRKATTGSIDAYDAAQPAGAAAVCRALRAEIERALPNATSKVWHSAPVWFVGETPVVGYDVAAKGDVTLLFWNGQTFEDPALKPIGKFRAAKVRYADTSEIELVPLRRWLKRAGRELWDIRSIRRPKPRTAKRDRS